MSLNVFNSITSINKTNHAFKQALIKKGLLNPNTGTMLVQVLMAKTASLLSGNR